MSTRMAVPGGSGDFTAFYGFAYDKTGFGFTANDATFGQSVWFERPGAAPS